MKMKKKNMKIWINCMMKYRLIQSSFIRVIFAKRTNQDQMTQIHAKLPTDYYPNCGILKQPNPAICSSQIAKQFEAALHAQIDAVLEENDKQNNGMDVSMNSEFGKKEFHRKLNWESYDLGFRNKSMHSALMKNGKLFTVLNKKYFAKNHISNFHQLKASNCITSYSVMSGLEKVLTKPIYLELVHKMMSIHKKYYFDKCIEWNAMS